MSITDDPVVVIGGGIAGLAAAWQLHRDGVPVRLFEAADRVGGKIRTTEFQGRMVDEAADAFLARVPHGIELARELGLGEQLISPAGRKAQVWTSEGLCRLPEPNVLGIPLERAAAEDLLGAEAADALDADLARTDPDPVLEDDTIGSLVRRRVGDRVHEMLVDPLIGSINAGDTHQLSLEASSPQIHAAAAAGPSLVRALREQAAGRSSDAPVFHSFEGGMGTLIDALADRLGDAITTGMIAREIVEQSDGRLHVDFEDNTHVYASAVVLAVPANVAGDILGDWEEVSLVLEAIPQISVTLVALAYPAGTIAQDADLSGFVVPRTAPELTITACSYAHAKWPHQGGDLDLLRVSVGHTGDQVTPDLDDEALLEVVLADVETALGVTADPVAHRITRWPASFPQYLTGHLDRLAFAEEELNPSGIFLAGMSYRGIGIPANIDQGRSAAVSAILHLLGDGEDR